MFRQSEQLVFENVYWVLLNINTKVSEWVSSVPISIPGIGIDVTWNFKCYKVWNKYQFEEHGEYGEYG